MMRLRVHRHALLVSGLALILVIGVSRCSPLAGSINKFGQPKSPVDVPAPMDVSLQRAQDAAKDAALNAAKDAAAREQARLARLKNLEARVLPFEDYRKEIRLLPKTQTLTLSLDAPDSGLVADALAEFRRSRSIVLKISGSGPDDCIAVLGVALPSTKVEAYGLSPLAAECVPGPSEGIWVFSISPSVSAQTWEAVATSLRGLTISVTNHPSISLAPLPEATPTPSAVPTPTPTANR
jgi:hypothetical protein